MWWKNENIKKLPNTIPGKKIQNCFINDEKLKYYEIEPIHLDFSSNKIPYTRTNC